MPDLKKKILVFIDWFFPAYKAGGPVTSVKNIVDYLNDYFEFFIITSDRDYLDEKPYKNIVFDKWIDFSQNVKVFYISQNNLSKKYITNLIKKINFDFAYINGIYSFYFSILPLSIVKKMQKKILVSPRGMLSEHAFSRKNLKKKLFLKLSKLIGLYKNILFHATNEEEKKDIIAVTGNKNVKVIPNLPRKIDLKEVAEKEKKQGELKIVSIARISQEKNTKFALEILSKITEGKITFDIFGSINDQNYWSECKEIITSMPKNITVNYKKTVNSENVLETFAKYHFSFMPSLGENFGHSIFESMAAATPVITTNNTPWKNLEENGIGWDIDLKNNYKFIDVLKSCLNLKQNQFNKISKKSFKFAKSFIDDNSFVKNYIKIFSDE